MSGPVRPDPARVEARGPALSFADIFGVVGLALVAGGCALVSIPLALIVTGGLLLIYAVLLGRAGA